MHRAVTHLLQLLALRCCLFRERLQPDDEGVAVAHCCLQRLLLALASLHQADGVLLTQAGVLGELLVHLRQHSSNTTARV